MSTADFTRLRALADAVCNGLATDEETKELEQLLSSDAAAREYYVDLLACDAELHWTIRTLRAGQAALPGRHATAAEREALTIGRAPRWLRSAMRPLMLAAAVAIVAIGAGLWHVWNRDVELPQTARPDQPPTTTSAEPVARLTHTVGVIWQDAAPQNAVKSPMDLSRSPRPLSLGEKVQLISGLAEIEYSTGARIVLQGPAEYVIGPNAEDRGEPGALAHSKSAISNQKSEVRNSGFLAYGKLTAHVPPAAVGFAVGSPDAMVTDLGTEFGMVVERIPPRPDLANSKAALVTEVHVLSGQVQVERYPSSLQSPLPMPQSTRLKAGEALRIGEADPRGPSATPLAANPDQFVRELSGPQGRLIAYEDWESIQRGEPASAITGWKRQGFRFEPPIQLEYANPAEPSPASIFGRNVLRFQDDDADAQHRNCFIYRMLPDEIAGRPLSIRLDYRAVRDGSTPMLSGLGLPLRLAPELAFGDGPPLATIRTGDWYRLTLDVPPPGVHRELGVHLERLENGVFSTVVDRRLALPPQTVEVANSEAAKTLNLGFAPVQRQALGGIWDLDNVEIRVRENEKAREKNTPAGR